MSGERGDQGESPRLLISRPGNYPQRYRIVALLVVKISLIGRFLLIFDNFENVYLFSILISAKTVLI
jgi:hypothetical protein